MKKTEEFQQFARGLFVKPEDDFVGRLVHASVGVAGEAGELLDIVKKTWIYEADLDAGHLLEECGDALFYISVLLSECGFSLQDAMDANMAKLKVRYPSGYTDGAARERADKLA